MLHGFLRRDARWRMLLVDQLHAEPGDRLLQVGGDGLLGLEINRRQPAAEVVLFEPQPQRPFGATGATGVGDVPSGDDFSEDVIKSYRPFNKAVFAFCAGDQPARSERLFKVVRHALPSAGELHIVEFRPGANRGWTVIGLLKAAGFKIIERTGALWSLLGPIELFKALKQPVVHSEPADRSHASSPPGREGITP